MKILDNDDLRDEQVRWEYLKYEFRKFTIRFSKNLLKRYEKRHNLLRKKFNGNLHTSKEAIFSFLENINLPTLTNEQALECEGITSETELLKALKSMKNDKSPGNDGITKEFYEFFWDDIKNSLSESIKKSFTSGELSTSQKQAVSKLINKRQRQSVNQELAPNFFVKYRS